MPEKKPEYNKLNLPDKGEENNREEQAELTISYLDAIKADQVFDTDENKINFLKEVDFEEFMEFSSSLNNIFRKEPVKSAAADGSSVKLEGALLGETHPPLPENKELLLRNMFDRVKTIDDPEDIAMMISGVFNGVHYFPDGNGRLSRLWHHLLVDGYDGSDEQQEQIKSNLGEDGRYDNLNFYPDLITKDIDNLIKEELEYPEDLLQLYLDRRLSNDVRKDRKKLLELIPVELDDDTKDNLLVIFSKTDMIAVHKKLKYSIWKYMKDTGQEDNSDFYNIKKEKFKHIDLEYFLQSLDNESVVRLIEIYKEIDRIEVEKYMDVIQESSSYKDQQNDITLKEKISLEAKKRITKE